MKKLVAVLLCLVMVLSLMACGAKQSEDVVEPEGGEEPTTGMANPWTEYASLDEINEQVGCKLCAPAAMGVSDEDFAVGDMGDYKMAEYRYTMGGYSYTFRCAPVTEDISGVYGADGKSAFEEPSDEELQIVTVDNTKLARWMNIDGQYVLMVVDNGEMEEDTFQSIAQEMMNLTGMDMANANGENG